MPSIFSIDDKNVSTPVGSIYTVDRQYLLTEDVAKDFNTYRNWGDARITGEDLYLSQSDDGKILTKTSIPPRTRKSLFNNVFGMPSQTPMQERMNMPLLDSPRIREEIHRRGLCTIKELCRASEAGEMGREIYNYSDFMYCKHLGKVSNNYMVTLRRFPYPCGDFINMWDPNDKYQQDTQQHLSDIGRLVTWMGVSGNKIDNIIKFTVKMPYKELEAKNQQTDEGGDTGGMLGTLFNMGNPKYISQVVSGRAGGGNGAFKFANDMTGGLLGLSANDKEDTYRQVAVYKDTTKVYGNSDVITKTMRRNDPLQDEGGLEFEQTITLVFDYQLRSYDGINTRAAMMDLLSNILTVTYTDGAFWKGCYTGTGVSQSNAFANLPLWDVVGKGPHDFTKGSTYKQIQDAGMQTLDSIGKSWAGGMGFDIKDPSTWMNAMKGLGNGLMNVLLGGMLNKLGRPHKQALNSLLSPAPVGLWHLTIGNPKHPIMSMGNMILDNTEITMYGPMGLDDIPTGIKVTITLKHAKPRDNGDIQRMFMGGDFRIYRPYDSGVMETYMASSPVTRRNDRNVQESQKSDPQNTDNKPQSNVKSQNEVKDISEGARQVFMKYFGTTESKNITWAAQEANHGSIEANKGKSEATAEQINKDNNPTVRTISYDDLVNGGTV